MTLTPEQKQAVTSWVSAGDNLSAIQKKLSEQFQISMTYRDVRFLVDDLNLELKDAAPKVDTSDVTKTPNAQGAAGAGKSPAAEKKGFFDKAKEKLGLAKEGAADEDVGAEEPLEEEFEDVEPVEGTSVSLTVDKVTLIPGALASGTVKFSDGVTAKWLVDQYGRPGFTEVSTPGYRPSPADGQAFMQELSVTLQKRGF
ncbi:MAG: hypothetical protein Q7S40_18805 [Opitutaceae bacterium]|nr:hypothetical protein [Opitutaceae bacterium]